VPDHSWLSRTRSRLPLEVHDTVFTSPWCTNTKRRNGFRECRASGDP
jgi:hypothetical protein